MLKINNVLNNNIMKNKFLNYKVKFSKMHKNLNNQIILKDSNNQLIKLTKMIIKIIVKMIIKMLIKMKTKMLIKTLTKITILILIINKIILKKFFKI